MILRQLSVFLENKPGRLYAVIDELGKNGIDIRALSLADTAEFGLLRLIVDDPDKAKAVLTDSGVIASSNHVLSVSIDDIPGGAVGVLKILSENGLSVEYTYAYVGKVSGKAHIIVRTNNNEEAERILTENGFKL